MVAIDRDAFGVLVVAHVSSHDYFLVITAREGSSLLPRVTLGKRI